MNIRLNALFILMVLLPAHPLVAQTVQTVIESQNLDEAFGIKGSVTSGGANDCQLSLTPNMQVGQSETQISRKIGSIFNTIQQS